MRQLTTPPGGGGSASVSPDNKHIVFQSTREGSLRLWRMDADGGGQVPLTSGPADYGPVVAGDSKSVYYNRGDQPSTPMYRVPIEGGTPTLFPVPTPGRTPSRMMAAISPRLVSPDGTWLLVIYWDDEQLTSRLAVVPTDGRNATRPIDVPLDMGRADSRAWTPDSRAITFVKVTNGVPNIWRQPIDGGSPTRVTNFTSGDPIDAHAWSPDGKRLAMVRSVSVRDIVVIKDLRK